MLDIYRAMMVYDWRYPCEYYCGISRIAFMNIELVNILIQNISRDKRNEVGRKLGEAAKVSMETTLGIQTTNPEKWSEVFNRLRIQGFGDFYLEDKYVLIKSPFINEPNIWAGFLGGLLGVDLDIKTLIPPFVLEIRTPTKEG